MKIGFIGLGIMGGPMCENIIRKHNDQVYVYDTAVEKIKDLECKGAIGCKDVVSLAKVSDIIITMVPKSKTSQEVYDSILSVLDETKTCIDMSTIDPSVSILISQKVKETRAQFIDAPVVKSQPAAIAGKLGIYVGGEKRTYDRMRSVLLYMGENVMYMGENGKGLVMKICHNALVSQIQNGVNETITLAKANGINVAMFAQAISYGGGQNFYLDSKCSAIQNETYTTAFSVENMAKDVDICINLANECGISMPGEKVVKNVYDSALNQGLAKEDFCATIKVVNAYE